MAKVEQLYALKAYYRVVYLDGLGLPVETVVGASESFDTESPDMLDEVCRFIQHGIDLDCRRVLFMYEEKPDSTKSPDIPES